MVSGIRLIQLFLVPAIVVCVSLFFPACSGEPQQAQIPEEYPTPERTFDLNTVTYDELLTIDGMRKNVARAIIDWREERPYRRVEDLISVDGIGEKTYLLIRRFFRVE